MTLFGTGYFESEKAAYKYYADYDLNRDEVNQKIEEKEIFIGKPQLKKNEELLIHKVERRYFVVIRTSHLPILFESNEFELVQ